MTLLEVGNLDGLLILILVIMFGPPLLLFIIGLAVKKQNPNAAKVLYIIAVLYLIVGLGICGGMIG